jgi:hypothetical protein
MLSGRSANASRRHLVGDRPKENWSDRKSTGRPAACSGAGGNHVLMFPSGLSMIRFMDADDYEVRDTTRAAETYRSSCR